uniref:Filament cap protein n=1 Tax=uncultured organism MedDCM-OCT-S09-C206 TaxID=743646 RepID=D6PKZ4_9ZZZZ|nr:possible flagellar hook associated protein 2 filament cap protein [uncultured organism MedDCM-OCT-S09-C206]
MVEVAKEVTKPDYLSLVNKSGSGFNVSELVDAIVGSEIEPKRNLQKTKQEKTENAISGIGFLASQASTTQTSFTSVKSDTFFEISSSNSSGVTIKATDETQLQAGIRSISNVTTAKKMAFEFGGFSNLTDKFTANLTIDLGKWTKTAASSSANTNSFASQKTYMVTAPISVGADVTKITSKSSYGGGTPIAANTTFTVLSGQSDTISSASIKEIDVYAFQDADGANADTVNFTDKSVSEVAALLNAVTGISATTVDTTGEGTNFSIIVTSDNTGADNGFKIASSIPRFATPTLPDASTTINRFSQLASDATFTLDGVQVTRESNSITDLLDGAEIELKSDFTTSASIGISRSETNIRSTVNSVISSLNEFKAEIDRLTFIDLEGDANGPLALDPAVNSIKSSFKKLAVEPLNGYGDKSIYLSQLGIKTDNNGDYFLDDTLFKKTFSSNPEYFQALKDENLATNTSSATVTKSPFTQIAVGTYTVSKDGAQWKFGDTNLTRFDYKGGSMFTSTTYPGLVIKTAAAEPASFNIYSGQSFSKRVADLMTKVVEVGSPLRNSEETYKTRSTDIEERLKKLEEREKLINSKYTEQFGKMEQSMTQFNSTKTLLENFIEAWKKQK